MVHIKRHSKRLLPAIGALTSTLSNVTISTLSNTTTSTSSNFTSPADLSNITSSTASNFTPSSLPNITPSSLPNGTASIPSNFTSSGTLSNDTTSGLSDNIAFPFNPGFDIQKVTVLAQSLPSHSWEYGTASEMLLELYDPLFSVFGFAPFPVPTLSKDRIKSLQYAASKIKFGTGINSLVGGNGTSGDADPASLGVSAVLLGKTNRTYADAADRTVAALLTILPRFSNGAISHRASVPELWADFIYQAPPFLAYYAVDQANATLLQEVVRQCGLYREVLQNHTGLLPGTWMHIIGPQSQDTGLWSSGNAWAAAGMARVLATIMKAPLAALLPWYQDAVNDLTQWIKEILDGARQAPLQDGLLRNYLDDIDIANLGFGEIAGSSLLAGVAYRMAVLQPEVFGKDYIAWADDIRVVLGGQDASGNPHVTDAGVVTPAVNPLWWKDKNPFITGSPEGQNFVVLMYTAWRDCVLVGKCKLKY